MSSKGLTSDEIAHACGIFPMLLSIPQATAAAVAAWLYVELGWTGSTIHMMLVKRPHLFGYSVVDNLAPKLA